MAGLWWLGRAAWAAVEDKWTLFVCGVCLCTVAPFLQALGRLTLQKNSLNLCASSLVLCSCKRPRATPAVLRCTDPSGPTNC